MNMPSSGTPYAKVIFFELAERLKPYFSTIYTLEVNTAGGAHVTDYLHPEWANLRFIKGPPIMAAIGDNTPRITPEFIVTGPTSKAAFFDCGTMQSWGIGMLPMGWAKFIAAPAAQYADDFFDGAADKNFAGFAPLVEKLRLLSSETSQKQADIINEYLCIILDEAGDDDEIVKKASGILVDENLSTVKDFAEQMDISMRTLERLCSKAFGFPPKILLRRQRFLRSLAQFMLDPSMKWINTLDHHYHDQAHFTRDFRRFMGMGAREYAALEKPIMSAAAFARMAATGAAMQVLHKPDEISQNSADI